MARAHRPPALPAEDVWLEAASWVSRRREERRPTRMVGVIRLHLAGGAERVEVLDISIRGCRVRSSLLKIGQRVWLRIGSVDARIGSVAWTGGGEAGVAFEATLHPAVVDHLAAGSWLGDS